MISTFVTLIRSDPNVYLKVPGLFCLYHDSNKLYKSEILSADVPYFIEIEYSDDDFPDEKMAYSSYSFSHSKKKLQIDSDKEHKVSKDTLRNEYLANKRNEIETLLLPFTDIFVFSYPNIQGWFLELDKINNNWRSKYGQLLYAYKDDSKEPEYLHKVDNEETFCNPIVFTQRNKESRELFRQIRLTEMFEAFYSSDKSVQKAVLSAARQYHKAESLFHIDPISRFLYQVYAIETLINAEYSSQPNPVCEKCKQKRFSVRKKFHEFIQNYSNSYDKKDVDKIYELRSAIVHSGQVLFQPNFFLYEDAIKEFEKKYINATTVELTARIVRETINKYVFTNSKIADFSSLRGE